MFFGALRHYLTTRRNIILQTFMYTTLAPISYTFFSLTKGNFLWVGLLIAFGLCVGITLLSNILAFIVWYFWLRKKINLMRDGQ